MSGKRGPYKRKPISRVYKIISLGGGTQSSTMTLMASKGIFGDIPDAAVYADTHWDPPSVTDLVKYLQKTISSFPIYTSSHGNLSEHVKQGVSIDGLNFLQIPAYIRKDGNKLAMMSRQCTDKYKVRPIIAKSREIMGLAPRQKASARGLHLEQWIGISYDEIHRMHDSKKHWISNRYPLVDLKLTREDCKKWWKDNAPKNAPPLTRSACAGCPYHTSAEWVKLSEETPDLYKETVEIEKSMQKHHPNVFLHRRGIPLEEALEIDKIKLKENDKESIYDDGSCDSGYCFV